MRAADVEKIVNAYGAVLAETTAIGLVRDIGSLPYSKDDIKSALKFALSATTDLGMRESLRTGYVSLADFQQLSETEVRALQLWNSALSRGTAAAPDLEMVELAETISTAGKEVIALQTRVAAESKSLLLELKAAGF